MDDTSKILAIIFVTVLANVALAGWLWWRHGMIRQVMVLLALTAALLVNGAIFAVRAEGGAAPAKSSAWNSR